MTIHSILTSDGPTISIDGSSTWKGNSIAAGDTFEIENGTYTRLTLNNVQGASGNPITFINDGGQVVFTGSVTSVHFEDLNNWIEFRGDGHPGTTYGFRCEEEVFRIRHRADNVTISYVHRIGISNREIGFQVKQDNTSAVEMSNIEFHHCKAEKVTEGWYNGDTGASLLTTQYRLSNITVRDCIVTDCYDGIQHNRDFGTSHIYNNVISNGRPDAQGSAYNGAIVIGHEMANVECYNNHVSDCDNFGINAQNANDGGSGDAINIYNNLFYQVGFGVNDGQNDAIKIAGAADSVRRIYNNTFIEVGVSGAGQAVNQSSMNASTDVYYYNNIALDIQNATEFDVGVTPIVNSNNHTDASYSRSTYGFTDQASGDFTLTVSSPAVNAGLTSEATPSDDLAGNSRDSSPDIGAYEFITPEVADRHRGAIPLSLFR